MDKKAPAVVKVVSTLTFITAGISILIALYALGLSSSPWATAPLRQEDILLLIGLFLFAALFLVLGFFYLRARNWARVTLLLISILWMIAWFILSAANSDFSNLVFAIPGLISAILIAVTYTSSRSKNFFSISRVD